MKHLKTYRLFESKGPVTALTQEQEKFLDDYTEGTWSYNDSTGLVDVKGDFNCNGASLGDFLGVRFGDVDGSFSCSRNDLTTLEGAPHKVKVDFLCDSNNLTSLKGAPQEVGRGFYCVGNTNLTTLEGAPQEVGEGFYCASNNLTTLVGGPKKVGRGFDCGANQLTTLKGAPQEVGGTFSCSGNRNLTTLVGGPKKVGGEFISENNKALITLEGAPQEISGSFYCNKSINLTTLVGGPKKVGGEFICYENGNLTTLEGAPQEVGGKFVWDSFRIKKGGWSIRGFLDILNGWGDQRDQKTIKLILTIIPIDTLNQEIKKDPAGMVRKLKKVWNDESFGEIKSKLIWPKGYEDKYKEQAGIAADLDDLGF